MPEQFVAYGRSWAVHHPDWQMQLWTDETLPEMRNAKEFALASSWAMKADILRYDVICQMGGVYVDTDLECLKTIDSLLENVGFLYADQRPGEPATAVLGTYPGHPFSEYLVDRLPDSFSANSNVLCRTGPIFFARCVLQYLGAFELRPHGTWGNHLLPVQGRAPLTAFFHEYFYPYWMGEQSTFDRAQSNAYAVHHWAHSWAGQWT
jgi:mannosyltransferase OCH1-like enzyme